MRELHSRRGTQIAGAAIGLFGALLLSAVMLVLRGHVSNVFMALVLVIPVLLGAFTGGRIAGFVSAVAATLSFDFFFTQPYLTLRIANHNDLATAIALLLLAGLASETGHRVRRRNRDARDARAAFDRLARVAELSARGADLEDIISSARAEIIGLFDLDDCAFETSDGPTAPRLNINGVLDRLAADDPDADLVLPPGGVTLAVTGRGHHYGQLVLYSNRPVRFTRLDHSAAVSIADELAIALATKPTNRPS
jgi:K+-sensing histidine kinase KdpD